MRDVYNAILKKKKGQSELDPMEQHAMMDVLKDIHNMASDDLGHDIKGMKKVTVASDSDEGLQEGLGKAGKLIHQHHMDKDADADADDVSNDMHAESRRHKLAKHSEMSDEDDGMADKMGDEEGDSDKAMEGYAKGGMIHPGQYGEAEADADGVEHQHMTGHDVIDNPQATIMKERGPGYAKGGQVAGRMIHPGQFGEAEADAMGAEHQYGAGHEVMEDGNATMLKERDTNPWPKGNMKDMHNNKPMANEADDDYGDLDDADIEALIAHLQNKRKSK